MSNDKPSHDCWKCLGVGWHWSCLEMGCDPEGCWEQECDCGWNSV